MTKNASQGSINQQIFPLIEESILSELPGPPLTASSTILAVAVVTGLSGLAPFGLSFLNVIVGPLAPAGCASIVDVVHF